MRSNIDTVDLGILYLLQQDARNYTTTEIGKKVGVSSSTVSNRIRALEDQGVIKGYHPFVNYEQAGFDNHYILTGTVSLTHRDEFVDTALSVSGVVSVREFLTTNHNISIELIGPTRQVVERSIGDLQNYGLSIEEIQIVSQVHQQPFDHFGKQFTDEA
jgi:DNA-binding Lrp family transcriptional regulator